MKTASAKIAVLAVLLAACAGQPTATNPPEPSLPAPTIFAPTVVLPTATAIAALTVAPSAVTPNPTATEASLFASVTEADWQLGPAGALVTLVEYSDFQCPSCGQLAPVLAQLHQEYPDEVRLVYRHFPLTDKHDKAQLAAEASEAAGAQGKFWEMRDLLFENQVAWVALPPANFRALLDTYAAQLDLDSTRFSADLDGGKFTQKVQAAYDTAIHIPLPGTPFLLFNGEPYQGPIDHWALAALVQLEKLKLRQFSAAPPDLIDPFRQYFATLHTARGNIVIELFAEKTPLTVNNFVFLAQQGWFDGVTFHRVLPGFVAQTGDPSGTGYGGPGYFIPDEIVPEYKFDAAGWVGMANAGPNTNGSQFFITLGPLPDLSGKYTIFGKVVSGLDVAAQLTPRDPTADPEAAPGDAITSITIEEK